MQKYIEELTAGDPFILDKQYWICGSDFKKDGSRNTISLKNGFLRWMAPETIVSPVELYILDSNSTIIPIKETKKDEINP